MSEHYEPLIETKSGGRWTATEGPLPGNAGHGYQDAYLSLIACPAVGECTAVGYYEAFGTTLAPLLTCVNQALKSGSNLNCRRRLPLDRAVTSSNPPSCPSYLPGHRY